MLDGIAAAEMLKGVRGAPPADREALATLIQNVSQLVARVPGNLRARSEPGVRYRRVRHRRRRAHRAGFQAPPARCRPSQEEIVRQMNRIMRPNAVAVIGASEEDGKIGNSVMKNLINGGYKGRSIRSTRAPPRSWARRPTRASRTCRRRSTWRYSPSPPSSWPRRSSRCGEKKIPGAVLIPSGFAETGNVAGQEELVEVGAQVRHPPDGAEHLRLLLHAEEPVRDLLHRLRREGHRRAVLAVGRHRHGDHRLLALGEDGRFGDRRPGQQVRHRRGRSADLLRAGRQHADHLPASARI